MKKVLLIMFLFACGMLTLGPSLTKSTKGSSATSSPTFNKEVVRIFQQNCQTCHHPGYIAPFSLMTYSEAKPFAEAIKTAVQSKTMPPWKAAEGCGSFNDERILTNDQIDTLSKWAEAGAPEGDIADLPPPVQFNSSWGLGEPDLALKSPEPYELRATGDDIYRCFVMPHVFEEDKYVTAVEVLPDAAEVVHHVLLFVDGKGTSVKLDEADPGPGYTSFGGPGFAPTAGLGGWAPGNTPRFSPKGVGIKIPKGSRIVMQVHYHSNGKTTPDQTKIGLHFSDTPLESELRSFPIFNIGFAIPPGAKKHKVIGQYTVPTGVNIKAIGVTPHMHLLGQKMKVEVTLPNGQKPNCMIDIPKWDFKWQGTYTYKESMLLPGGSKIKLTAIYDNSTNNPFNPNNPPKTVTWGEQTTDEMCLAFVSYILDRKPTSAQEANIMAPMVDKIALDPAANPKIKMGGKDLMEQANIRLMGSILSSSPSEMYNWAPAYSKSQMNILPWRSPKNEDIPQKPLCH
ncbi:MAG: ascorbate-dependent monooxygenase [Acidobacteria bacterium]|nr:ascorbate-dependent monooxygenase [Acidobacteriota bacterium]